MEMESDLPSKLAVASDGNGVAAAWLSGPLKTKVLEIQGLYLALVQPPNDSAELEVVVREVRKAEQDLVTLLRRHKERLPAQGIVLLPHGAELGGWEMDGRDMATALLSYEVAPAGMGAEDAALAFAADWLRRDKAALDHFRRFLG